MTPEQVTVDAIVAWVAALALLLSFGSTLWTLLNSGARRNASRLDEHTGRLDRHEARLQGVEQTLRSLPGSADIHKLELALAEMNGKLGIIAAQQEGSNQIMRRLETMVGRHDEHLKSK